MEKRRLGRNGPEVGAIGLGCMSFGGMYGATSPEESKACLAAALDLGIDHLDTSNVYGAGVSETVIGDFLRDHPDRFTIATKGGIIHGPPRRFDNSPEHLREQLEGSLRRLGVEHVALYYVHRREADRPIEDVTETMVRFKEEGKIGGIGFSEISPGSLERANAVHPVSAVQNEYSLWTRLPELGAIQRCEALGATFVAFSPLARGMFSRVPPDPASLPKSDFRVQSPRFRGPNYAHNAKKIQHFCDYAVEHGHSPAALAIAWTLARSPSVIPIPGTRSAAHLRELAAGANIGLSASDVAEIEDILPVGFAWGDRYSDSQTIGPERYC